MFGQQDDKEGGSGEFLKLWEEFFQSFKELMKDPNSSQKLYAVKAFEKIQSMMKKNLEDMSEKFGVDFSNLEKALEENKGTEGKEYREIKEAISQAKQELNKLFDQAREQFGDKKRKQGKMIDKQERLDERYRG